VSDDALRRLLDRAAIEDTLYGYGACVDRFDLEGLRALLADDLRAQYGNNEPLAGADAVVRFIEESTRGCLWQHHLLSVYRVDVAGDEAKALVYHTSHRVLERDPATVQVTVARYHDELTRGPGGWRISRLVLEVLWSERRTDATGALELLGGRGPASD
jgi:hypothetical protein